MIQRIDVKTNEGDFSLIRDDRHLKDLHPYRRISVSETGTQIEEIDLTTWNEYASQCEPKEVFPNSDWGTGTLLDLQTKGASE